jgi:Protein of unknown function (DUF3224)
MRLTAQFEIKSWDEQPFDEGEGLAKLTHAVVEKAYSGDLEATSITQWLMAYQPDETAGFVGIERIRGTFGGKSGSVVLQHVGKYADGAATASLTVLSGTGDLAQAAGTGDFRADPAGSLTLDLE